MLQSECLPLDKLGLILLFLQRGHVFSWVVGLSVISITWNVLDDFPEISARVMTQNNQLHFGVIWMHIWIQEFVFSFFNNAKSSFIIHSEIPHSWGVYCSGKATKENPNMGNC